MNMTETHHLKVSVERYARFSWEAWVEDDPDDVLEDSEGMIRINHQGLTRRGAIRGLRKRIARRMKRISTRETIEWTVRS